MMWHHYYYSSPFSLLDLGLNIFFCILIIWLIAAVISHFYDLHDEPKSDDRFIEIAKERYAKGEITKKEFEELKKDLITK